MKERIRRIVKNECDNPRIGVRWAMGVSALAVLASVGAALAQERPAARERRDDGQRPQVRQEQAAPRPAVAGRRNVLTKLRDQLQEQARDTEAAIRQRGDEAGPDGRVLRAELDTLREQIELVEQQLRDLEGGPRRASQAQPRPPELEARFNELRRHREELAENARRMERELGGLKDGQDQEARELKAHLERLHAQMGDVDRQLAELQRAPAGVRIARARTPQPQALPENLRQRRAALAEETRLIEQRLKELRPDQDQEARELQARLQALRAQMAALDNRPEGLPRVQGRVERAGAAAEPRPRMAPAENPRLEAQVEELRNQMRELREQMQQMQKLMEQTATRGRVREGAGEPR